MAKAKKYTAMYFDKEVIDLAVKEEFSNICKRRGINRGRLINEFMRKTIEQTYGPDAEKFIESTREYLGRKKAKKEPNSHDI